MSVRPLTQAAAGLALIAVDARIVHVDVLPDALGWALIALAAWQLANRRAAGVAAVAAVAAIGDLALPHRYDAIDPLTGEVVPPSRVTPGSGFHELLAFEHLEGVRLLALLVALVAGTAALWLLLSTLEERARRSDDERDAKLLRAGRWAVALVWCTPQLVVALVQLAREGQVDPVWNGAHELLAVAGLGVMAVLGAVLAVSANRAWAMPRSGGPTPWATMMVRDLQSPTRHAEDDY